MTIADVARSEQISERQAQRYCREGYQGHVLKAVKLGKSYSISELDYRRWRQECGFDVLVEARPAEVVQVEVIADPPREIQAPAPSFRPWPMCADPAGPVTNAPHERSSNWPHPLAVEQHSAELLREQQRKIRGYADDEV